SEFQDRVLRGSCGRLGRALAGGLRRSADGSQVLFDAPGIYDGGTPGNCGRGRSPGRTRSDGLARRADEQVMGKVTAPLNPTRGLSGPPALLSRSKPLGLFGRKAFLWRID